MRNCNTCRLATVCPVYEEDAKCKFHVQVPQVETESDIDAVANRVLALQVDRVHHALLQEKLEGSLSDSTDKQIELLTNLLKAKQKAAKSNTIKIEGSGAGVNVLGTLLANLGQGRKTSSGSTQRPEDRHYSKMKEQEAIDDAEYTDVIDVTPAAPRDKL